MGLPGIWSVGPAKERHVSPESIQESLLNPDASNTHGQGTVTVVRSRGEVVTGTLRRPTNDAVLIPDQNGRVVSIPGEVIDEIESSPVSLMLTNLLRSLRRYELVDLLAYLIGLKLPHSGTANRGEEKQ